MFSIFKRKENVQSNLESLDTIKVDMHSHILPGIDDGAQNIEESLALIECLVNKGFEQFICTPHVYKELYPNTTETIKAAYDNLLPFVEKKFPHVQIKFAAEYFMDDNFDAAIENNEKLLTVFDNNVLVEHSFVQAPFDLKQKFFNLQMAGYNPIIAHPERYEFYMANKKAYHTLYDIGCILQVNLLSLIGYYGKAPMELSKYLIDNKLVKLVGTDIHNSRHIHGFNTFANNKHLKDLIQQDVLLNNNLKI
jgi:tyrosine-protein phosphatase YwqE